MRLLALEGLIVAAGQVNEVVDVIPQLAAPWRQVLFVGRFARYPRAVSVVSGWTSGRGDGRDNFDEHGWRVGPRAPGCLI